MVYAKNLQSELQQITFGVPQGSILGPLPFLSYINDIQNVLNSTPRLFADDTCLVCGSNNLDDLQIISNNALDKLSRWCDSNEFDYKFIKIYIYTSSSQFETKIGRRCHDIIL